MCLLGFNSNSTGIPCTNGSFILFPFHNKQSLHGATDDEISFNNRNSYNNCRSLKPKKQSLVPPCPPQMAMVVPYFYGGAPNTAGLAFCATPSLFMVTKIDNTMHHVDTLHSSFFRSSLCCSNF